MQVNNFFYIPLTQIPGVKAVRYVFVIFWLIMWLTSVQMWFRFSECDYSDMAELTGKYGVGCKPVFGKDGTHIMMYYPIDKAAYTEALKDSSKKALRDPFKNLKEGM